MTARLTVVGLGPGGPEYWTPAARLALSEASDLVGYGLYVDRIPELAPRQQRHVSDNRVEIERARLALELAAAGRRVAVVSGGDAGVFGMAAAIFEAIESGDPAWRALDVRVEPGVTAMLAAAAQAGAPLGADFCAISLSDNLKSWATIEQRLRAAAGADFVIALYNPASRARPHQLDQAFDVLRLIRKPDDVVLFVRATGSDKAMLAAKSIADARASDADMRTLVIIGSSRTRALARRHGAPWYYTPRSERELP